MSIASSSPSLGRRVLSRPRAAPESDAEAGAAQIVIGGRNKYLINGHVAQPRCDSCCRLRLRRLGCVPNTHARYSRVQNLFHSVQLNVNNPHFLIMQGRITKVLNMKPPEILSMLEEVRWMRGYRACQLLTAFAQAAGTRMYETKKENALKTLDKKQTKVEEINKVRVKRKRSLATCQLTDVLSSIVAVGGRHSSRPGEAAQGARRLYALGIRKRQTGAAAPLLRRVRVRQSYRRQGQLGGRNGGAQGDVAHTSRRGQGRAGGHL